MKQQSILHQPVWRVLKKVAPRSWPLQLQEGDSSLAAQACMFAAFVCCCILVIILSFVVYARHEARLWRLCVLLADSAAHGAAGGYVCCAAAITQTAMRTWRVYAKSLMRCASLRSHLQGQTAARGSAVPLAQNVPWRGVPGSRSSRSGTEHLFFRAFQSIGSGCRSLASSTRGLTRSWCSLER